jgi:RHS repeat-associated protein
MLSPHKTVLCQYRYDALDQLIESSPQQAPQLQRFYCKSRLATEIQGTTQHSIIQHGDLLLAQQQREGNERNAHLLATDQQRSVLRTLNANSHSKPITYSPYGHRHPENGWLSLLGFNGERPDPVTGHYLLGNGYRAFNPVLMRFNSPDSWSPFGKGGFNAYAYCGGNPINRSDPTGHFTPVKILASTASTIITQIADYLPYTFNLKPGISTTQAIKAINDMDELLFARSHAIYQNMEYLKELKALRNNRLNLQKITTEHLQSKSYPIDKLPLPPGLKSSLKNIDATSERHKLLEYIDINKYGATIDEPGPIHWENLRKAREGNFRPSIPHSKLPTPESANAYWHELYNIENPHHNELTALIQSIREAHFLN